MSDTPETDAKVSGHIGFYSCATVPAELCRRMERERDAARKDLELRCDLYKVQEELLDVTRCQRDEARAQIKELIYIAEWAIALADIDLENEKFGVVSELRSNLEKIKEVGK